MNGMSFNIGDTVTHKTSKVPMVIFKIDGHGKDLHCSFLVQKPDSAPMKGVGIFKDIELELIASGNYATQYKARIGNTVIHKSNPGLKLFVVGIKPESISEFAATLICSHFYEFDAKNPKVEFEFVEFELELPKVSESK